MALACVSYVPPLTFNVFFVSIFAAFVFRGGDAI